MTKLFKILIYIHVIILILSFVSCNKSENSKNTSEDSIKSEDTNTKSTNDISEDTNTEPINDISKSIIGVWQDTSDDTNYQKTKKTIIKIYPDGYMKTIVDLSDKGLGLGSDVMNTYKYEIAGQYFFWNDGNTETTYKTKIENDTMFWTMVSIYDIASKSYYPSSYLPSSQDEPQTFKKISEIDTAPYSPYRN